MKYAIWVSWRVLSWAGHLDVMGHIMGHWYIAPGAPFVSPLQQTALKMNVKHHLKWTAGPLGAITAQKLSLTLGSPSRVRRPVFLIILPTLSSFKWRRMPTRAAWGGIPLGIQRYSLRSWLPPAFSLFKSETNALYLFKPFILPFFGKQILKYTYSSKRFPPTPAA